MNAPAAFADWLGATSLSQTLQTVGWVVPTVQSLHILAIALVITPALLLTVRLLTARAATAPRGTLLRMMSIGLALLLASGALLIIAEPRRELLSLVFQAKMTLVILASALTAWLHRRGSIRSPGLLKIAALICLMLWIAIVFCGRWIAYVDHG